MGFLITSIILFIILFIALGYNFLDNDWRLRPTQLLSPIAFVILLFGIFTQVNANQVGIVYISVGPNKGIQEETLGEGLHLKSIFAKVTKVSTTNRTAFLEVAGQTEDSIYALFQITLVYRIDGMNAGRFFKITGSPEITQDQLNSITKEALQSATINYDIYGILGKDLEDVRLEFVNKLTILMVTRYNLTVISASFDDIDSGADIEKSIQDKAKAIQQILIAEQERQRAIVDAQTSIIRAEAAAQVILINAQATADAQIILNSVTVNAILAMYTGQFASGENTATPEIYGYLTIQEVTKTILTQLYYDTWDGKLPDVIAGDDVSLIIQP